MLTNLTVRNFKSFGEVDIELGDPVVFIGPNNSGKTSALQALALWEVGLRHWNEKRKGKTAPEKRPGVTINRRDLVSIPIPDANLLWRDLRVRNVQQVSGIPDTKNIRIDITVEGVTEDTKWKCGLEFDYANQESFYCRPLRLSEIKNPDRCQFRRKQERFRWLSSCPVYPQMRLASTLVQSTYASVKGELLKSSATSVTRFIQNTKNIGRSWFPRSSRCLDQSFMSPDTSPSVVRSKWITGKRGTTNFLTSLLPAEDFSRPFSYSHTCTPTGEPSSY